MMIMIFPSSSSSLSSFLSIIDCFRGFACRRVITLIQSPNLVYIVFIFDLNSNLVQKVTDVIRVELLATGILIPRITNENVEDNKVELDTGKSSVIFKQVSFYSKLIIYLKKSLSFSRNFKNLL